MFLYSNLVYFFFIICVQHYSKLFFIKYHKIIRASHEQLISIQKLPMSPEHWLLKYKQNPWPWLNHMLSCNFSQYGPSTKLPRMNQPSIQSKKERKKKFVCDFTFSFTRQGSVVKQETWLSANYFWRISNISYSNM